MNAALKLGIGAALSIGAGIGGTAIYDRLHGKGGAIVGPLEVLGLGGGAAIAGSTLAHLPATGGSGTLGSYLLRSLPAAGLGAGIAALGVGAAYLTQRVLDGKGGARDAHEGEQIMAPGPIGRPAGDSSTTVLAHGGSDDLRISDGVYRPDRDGAVTYDDGVYRPSEDRGTVVPL